MKRHKLAVQQGEGKGCLPTTPSFLTTGGLVGAMLVACADLRRAHLCVWTANSPRRPSRSAHAQRSSRSGSMAPTNPFGKAEPSQPGRRRGGAKEHVGQATGGRWRLGLGTDWSLKASYHLATLLLWNSNFATCPMLDSLKISTIPRWGIIRMRLNHRFQRYRTTFAKSGHIHRALLHLRYLINGRNAAGRSRAPGLPPNASGEDLRPPPLPPLGSRKERKHLVGDSSW